MKEKKPQRDRSRLPEGEGALSRESETLRDPVSRAARLAEILDAYAAEKKEGKAPDKEALCARHPEFAAELRECLPALDLIGRASEPRDELAQVRLGDFRILREIGRGGMGVVYEAEQISLKRRVALKVLRFGGFGDAEAMKRFEREALTLALLHHTHIVPIIAFGSEGNVHYYAMNYIEGRNAAERLREAAQTEGGLDPRTVARWALEIAEALEYAHGRGIIHRDVKPSNILIDAQGQTWLTDFGLARRTSDVNISMGMILGTYRYMSPEQTLAVSNPIDRRTDIYSLGATLYELVTGRPVFEGDDPDRVMARIRSEEPASPRSHRKEVSRDLEAVILRCLEKEPERRFQGAGALAENLRAYLQDRPLSIRHYGLTTRVGRWMRKRRDAISIVLRTLLMAVLFAGASAAIFFSIISKELPKIGFFSNDPSLQVFVEGADGDEGTGSIRYASPFWPGRNAVDVPPGSHRCRVEAPGFVDEEHFLEIEKGDRGSDLTSIVLDLGHQTLWEAAGIRSASAVTDLGDGPRIFAVSESGFLSLEASSGNLLWSTIVNDRSLKAAFLEPPYPRLLGSRPFPDFDGDGGPDLVWSSRARPALLAISGKDGRILCRYEATCKEPEGFQAFGLPAVLDVDKDEVPDLVATFQAKESPHAFWIEAISGRPGAKDSPIWRYESPDENSQVLIARAIDVGKSSAGEGGPCIACATGQGLFFLDVRGGSRLQDRDIKVSMLAPPEFADLDGDGRLDMVCLGMKRNPDAVTLSAIGLPDGKPLWTEVPLYRHKDSIAESVQSLHARYGREDVRLEAFHLGDIDGDGRLEVLAPYQDGRGSGVLCICAREGNEIWRVKTRPWGYEFQPIRSFILGPDMDGDALDDIYTFSSLRFYEYEIAVFSSRREGVDGNTRIKNAFLEIPLTLGSWDYRAPMDLIPWLGIDGASSNLIITGIYPSGPDLYPHLCPLSRVKRRDLPALPAAIGPQVADLDGDGFSDLYFTVDGRLRALRGTTRTLWRRFKDCLTIQDLNRDGIKELLTLRTAGQSSIVDGKSGARIRSTRLNGLKRVLSTPFPHGIGDLDGDGAPEILMIKISNEQSIKVGDARISRDIFPLSGKDGEVLWSGARIAPDHPSSFDKERAGESDVYLDINLSEAARADLKDVNGDGCEEVACLLVDRYSQGARYPWEGSIQGERKEVIQLIAILLDGKNGTKRWFSRFWEASGESSGNMWNALGLSSGSRESSPPEEITRTRFCFSDCNGDGILDLSLAVPVPGEGGSVGWSIRALDGRSGGELWRFPFPQEKSQGGNIVWSSFPFDLDGDGVDELVIDSSDPGEGAGKNLEGETRRWITCFSPRGKELLWSWSFEDGSAHPAGETVLPFLARDGKRYLCISHADARGSHLVFLDSGGKVARSLEGDGEFRLLSRRKGIPDHPEILLYLDRNRLRSRLDLDAEAWSAEFPFESARLDGILKGVGGESGGDVLLIQDGTDLRGLSAKTGELLWKSHDSRDPEVLTVRAGDRPLVVCRGDSGSGTACKEVQVLRKGAGLWAGDLGSSSLGSADREKPSRAHPFSEVSSEKGERLLRWAIPIAYWPFGFLWIILPGKVFRWWREKRSRRRRYVSISALALLGLVPIGYAILCMFIVDINILYRSLLCLAVVILWIPMCSILLPFHYFCTTFFRSLIFGPLRELGRLLLWTAAALPFVACIPYPFFMKKFSLFEWALACLKSPDAWSLNLDMAIYLVGLGMALRRAWIHLLRPGWARLRAWRLSRARGQAV